MEGKETKAGYGFGLRVAENYKRKGLGQALTLLAEKWAQDQGAKYIYFSVNKGEKHLIAWYKRLGMSVVDDRKIDFDLLYSKKFSNLKFLILPKTPEKTAEFITRETLESKRQVYNALFSKEYKNVDLSPTLIADHCLRNPNYDSSVIIREKEEIKIIAHFYNKCEEGSLRAERILFSRDTWKNPLFIHCCVFVVLVLCFMIFGKYVLGYSNFFVHYFGLFLTAMVPGTLFHYLTFLSLYFDTEAAVMVGGFYSKDENFEDDRETMVRMSADYLIGKGKKGILWNTSNRMNKRWSYDVAVFMAKDFRGKKES